MQGFTEQRSERAKKRAGASLKALTLAEKVWRDRVESAARRPVGGHDASHGTSPWHDEVPNGSFDVFLLVSTPSISMMHVTLPVAVSFATDNTTGVRAYIVKCRPTLPSDGVVSGMTTRVSRLMPVGERKTTVVVAAVPSVRYVTTCSVACGLMRPPLCHSATRTATTAMHTAPMASSGTSLSRVGPDRALSRTSHRPATVQALPDRRFEVGYAGKGCESAIAR